MRAAAAAAAPGGYDFVVGQRTTTKPAGRPRKANAVRRGWRLHVDLEPTYRRRIEEHLTEIGNPPLAAFIRRCLDWGLRHGFDGVDSFNVRIIPDRDEKIAKALRRLAVQEAAGCEGAMELEEDDAQIKALRHQRSQWLDVAGWCDDLIEECERFRRQQAKGKTAKASHANFHPDTEDVTPNLHSS